MRDWKSPKFVPGHSLKLEVRMSWMSAECQETKLEWKEPIANILRVGLDCLRKLVRLELPQSARIVVERKVRVQWGSDPVEPWRPL